MAGFNTRAVFISGLICLSCSILLATVVDIDTIFPWHSCWKTQSEGVTEKHYNTPHTASWTSWWHPQRLIKDVFQSSTNRNDQGGGIMTRDWNILYHLGGNGPWVEKVDGTVEGGIAVPPTCTVDQVHMMSRHAERYPTIRVGMRMLDLMQKIGNANITLVGDLSFVNNWEFFAPDPQSQFEQLTTTGPFSGTLGAFTAGVKLRTRYHHLLSHRLAHRQKTSLWAGDCQRVIDTARYFSAGFFGIDWRNSAILHIIPETGDRHADTLTPGRTCLNYAIEKERGDNLGVQMLVKYRSTYLQSVRERLRQQNPGIDFTEDEIYAMQEMCGFEITIRGSSEWCNVFTIKEWQEFEYARDIIHFYRSGPGTRYSGAMGWVWLNATANILSQGPEAGPLFFSFVHDGDIIPLLTALNIFHNNEDLPVTHTDEQRKWRTSQLTPMGGRIIFERLTCSTSSKFENNTYVRININDGVIAIPGCEDGPGRSCPLPQFLTRVQSRGEEVGDFRELCGLPKSAAEKISFLHQ